MAVRPRVVPVGARPTKKDNSMKPRHVAASLAVVALLGAPFGWAASPAIVPAVDQQRVRRSGNWQESRFRFAKTASLQTGENGAALQFGFEGTAVAVRLGGHNVPAYGSPNLGQLVATIDGENRTVITPRAEPRELLLATGLTPGTHQVRLEHRHDGDLTGCRVESFHTWDDARGELRFHVSGEKDSHLVDCRATVRQGDTVVRSALVRNWMTGQSSLTGLPPATAYSLEIQATGWKTPRNILFEIRPGETTELAPIYLRRDPATVIQRFRFPRLNQPAIGRPSETFRARFLAYNAKIDEVRLTRTVGGAVISRSASFEEDEDAAYYYDRELVVTLPDDVPPGCYDLTVLTSGQRSGLCRSPGSVHVSERYPTDPTFVTFGHLDTSAQYQAEYLERLVKVINLLAPDMVLCSNACNPAYVSGAFAGLDMPYVINFGNHQFPGHESWYGDPVGLVDYGPHVSVLNFGYPWHDNRSKAEALLGSRPNTAIRVINAFEANAPFSLLDKYQVRMIHDGHGTGKKVTDFGATPTRRIGKSNSESFRVVRFRNNRVESCTYNDHETAPIPFARNSDSPLSVSFRHSNDGTRSTNTATVTNRLAEAYSNGRVTCLMPAGRYEIQGGRLESQVLSDDGRFHVLSVRVDMPANGEVSVDVQPRE
jgi:hypothetical protein